MKPETLGEVHIMFQNLLGEVKTLTTHLEENTGVTKQVLTQATLTNGRVNKIEPLALDYQVNRERIKGAIMFGSVVSVLIISMFTYMGKLYIDSKEATITQNVSQAVYDKIIKEFDVVVNK